jgi:type IV pilus assembly protein PilO
VAASGFDLNQILSQIERLPQAARYGLLAGVFVAVIGIYWATIYGGERDQLDAKQAQLTKLQSEIAEARAVASNLKSFQEQRELLRKELEGALQRLPNDTELPGLLTDISGLGKKSGLEIRAFNPGAKVSRGFYAEVPIQLEFYGSYHELGVFFDRLSRLSRIVNITELSMTLAEDGDKPKLQIKGVATTFQFVTQTADSAMGE